jgi:hypothetical protein
MGVYVVKTNELCGQCLYLNAVDMPNENVRATVVELNDLCRNCIDNCKKLSLRPLTDSEYQRPDIKKIQEDSPFLKDLRILKDIVCP